ncbi:MAG TPA: hypothetical protein VGW76_21055 [Pyrinomonadaceae bacterium]|nr:hypothetical protein [Pyrinomonadaceae bacterium]
MKNKTLLAAFLITTVFGLHAHGQTAELQTQPQTITLFSRITYKDQGYGRSAFNFRHGVRSDVEGWEKLTNNYSPLLYGSISINGDTDWFSISMGGEDPSRIKDLGELEWSQVYYTPFLPANPPLSSGIRFPGKNEPFESSSEGRVTQVVAGHMYVVHIKNRETNLYAMFRVDALEPSHHCTISWKLVPSPED